MPTGIDCWDLGGGELRGGCFLVAKSASAATAVMAVTRILGLDDWWWSPVVASAMLGVVLLGLRRSQWLNSMLVFITVVGLLVVIIWGLVQPSGSRSEQVSISETTEFIPTSSVQMPPAQTSAASSPIVGIGSEQSHDWVLFLQATALLFVAFTGYGRVATMAEEVREPSRTIPRAIIATIAVTILLYVGVAAAGLSVVGPEQWYQQTLQQATPVIDIVATVAPNWIWLIQVAALTAMLGVILNLLLGLSRVVLAMGREGDLPASCAQLNAQQEPQVATCVVGAGVIGLSCIDNLVVTWSLSAVAVLAYYALTNAAALRLDVEQRQFPRAVSWLGLAMCLGLVWTLDGASLLWASVVMAFVLMSAVGRRWWKTRDACV